MAQTNVAGSNGYGTFSIDASGNWTYTMNSAHNEFVAGQNYTDTVTVTTVDGTSQVLFGVSIDIGPREVVTLPGLLALLARLSAASGDGVSLRFGDTWRLRPAPRLLRIFGRWWHGYIKMGIGR